ncbi:Hypothetical predicted protein [Xyrichtys novacula]|uniref:Uncharacterized protein n=1 Tax=Xyrichtys novacula TaxID=13765 RepID=A0AAV1HMI1_XYRNO|nr:Hypothetical predicted protein [Xyrichtys novacula]
MAVSQLLAGCGVRTISPPPCHFNPDGNDGVAAVRELGPLRGRRLTSEISFDASHGENRFSDSVLKVSDVSLRTTSEKLPLMQLKTTCCRKPSCTSKLFVFE